MDDVLKDDESVKFFTGIPSLACFMMIFNLVKPFAEKLKYWDKNKEKEVSYQKVQVKKAWKAKIIDHYGGMYLNFGETQT